MKNINAYYLFLFLIIASCQKEEKKNFNSPASSEPSTLSVKEVKAFLETERTKTSTDSAFNISSLINKIDWKNIKHTKNHDGITATFAGEIIKNGTKVGFKKVYFQKDSLGKIQTEIIEVIPDLWHLWKYKGINRTHFSGDVFIFNKDYKLKTGFIVKEGKPIGKIKPVSKSINKDVKTPKTKGWMSNCYWVRESYVTYIDVYPTVVIYDHQICENVYVQDYYSYVPQSSYEYSYYYGTGTTTNPSYDPNNIYGRNIPEPVLPGNSDPDIRDINAFLIPFGIRQYPTSSYSITVFVQEPSYGVNSSAGFVNGTGHTCIALTKDNITQVIGFYPKGGYTSLITGQNVYSTLKDNGTGNMHFTSSKTFYLYNDEFEKALEFLKRYNPNQYTYNLFSRNCTNFAYDVCSYIGFQLPASNASGPTERSPGQLGSDLRKEKYYNNDSGINTTGGTVPRGYGGGR